MIGTRTCNLPIPSIPSIPSPNPFHLLSITFSHCPVLFNKSALISKLTPSPPPLNPARLSLPLFPEQRLNSMNITSSQDYIYVSPHLRIKSVRRTIKFSINIHHFLPAYSSQKVFPHSLSLPFLSFPSHPLHCLSLVLLPFLSPLFSPILSALLPPSPGSTLSNPIFPIRGVRWLYPGVLAQSLQNPSPD